jgi:hypothetical protein
MTLSVAKLLHLLGLGVLQSASLLVPGRQRPEWRREWRAELWHVRRTCTPQQGVAWDGEREVAAFCFGAFEDALSLRREIAFAKNSGRVPLATTTGSATQCIVFLTCLIAVSLGVSTLVPSVAEVLLPHSYRDARHLMLIQEAHSSDEAVATIAAQQFHSWRTRQQGLFDDFAFYRLESEILAGSMQRQTKLRVAHASSNLFDLLGVELRGLGGSGVAQDGRRRVILSDEVWRREFARDPNVIGRVVEIATQDVVVSGVARQGAWNLPGTVDVWLLEPAEGMERGVGFVVAHLKASKEHAVWGDRWEMTAARPDGSADDWSCTSLASRSRSPLGIFVFTVLLACLALPATTSLPLGEYPSNAGSSSNPSNPKTLRWSTSLRRWSFLVGKILLLLPIVYLVSLDLSHWKATIDPSTSQYIQIVSSFSICLFGLRWGLRDQRQRCPVCLGKLTHPARVGEPSRNFLTWNGVELICAGGHGLMHIPELPTSWFNTQRWLDLDASWEGLFVDAGLAGAGEF